MSYVYRDALYFLAPATLFQQARLFGLYLRGDLALQGVPTRAEVEIRRRQSYTVGHWNTLPLGLGGWNQDVHHFYDPTGKVLNLGTGQRRVARELGPVITTLVASTHGSGNELTAPEGVAAGPDGSIYIADTHNNRVLKAQPDGTIVQIAGVGSGGGGGSDLLDREAVDGDHTSRESRAIEGLGDGGLATQAQLLLPRAVAVGADGSVYIADSGHYAIRRVGPDGIITTVAGTGTAGFSGDNGPAVQAELANPTGIAVGGGDESLYIADTNNHRVRRVGPDGFITTVAGTGASGFSGDEGLASQAQLATPSGVAVNPDGSLYIADAGNHRIRRVLLNGTISTVAGTGASGFSGDGGPAIQAELFNPRNVSVGPDGRLYVADEANNRIRLVLPDGTITTVAGSDNATSLGDNGPATSAQLLQPSAVVVGPDQALYIANTSNHRIRRVDDVLPGFSLGEIVVASESSDEVYVFSKVGRHLHTVNTLTGAIRYQFGYDSAGRLTEITDGDGNLTTIERNAQGAPMGIVSPYGQQTTLAVNSDGYLTSVTNPASETTTFTYTNTGLMTGMTTPRGHASQYTYDSVGRLIRNDDPAGGFQTLTRTESAQQTTVTHSTALGQTTQYTVEGLSSEDRRRVTQYPDGTESVTEIGQNGSRTTTAPDGTVTITQAGPDLRFGMQDPTTTTASVVTPGGLVATTTTERSVELADPDNPLSLVTQSEILTRNGRTTTSVYDAGTRTTTTTSPAGRQATTVLDTQGRITQQEVSGLAPVQFSYDARGRLSLLGQGSRASTFTYDAQGHLATVTDPAARVTSFTRNAVGRPLTQTLPDGRVITFTYDANGNLTSLSPPSRPAHGFTFTPIDLTQNYLTPPVTGGGTNTTTYTYDLDRKPTRVTRPDGQEIVLNYDGAGRIISRVTPTGAFGLGYDGAGRLQSQNAPSGANLTYSYDGSLLTQTVVTGPVSGSITWSYDPDFHATAQSINSGNTINFSYDDDNLLTGAGNLTLNRDLQNGLLTGTTLGSVSDTVSYNPFAEPLDYQATVNNLPVFHVQYTRDTLGWIAQKTETIDSTTDTYDYAYDLAGRLIEVKLNGVILATYTYDPNGNRLTKAAPAGTQTGTYDDQDRLLTYNGNTYTYTANGELSAVTRPLTSGPASYAYDVLGNLLGVTQPDGTIIEHIIDGAQRRVGKKINGTLVQGFLYQGQLQPVAELDGSGNITARFVYASKGNIPDYMVKDSVTYRILSDYLGSPRLVVDVTTGAIVQRMDYDEFGQVITDTNPGFQPFGFAGGLYDRDIKLVRFGARDYDPETGRWSAKDPIGFGGGDTNLYGYVLNDPINWFDPLGLQNFPPPPPNIPGGPWTWRPDPGNDRGGTYNDPNNQSASWDTKIDHWDVNDGKGGRQRYDCRGNPITPEQAHNYKGPKQNPIDFTNKKKGPKGIKGLGKLGGALGAVGTILDAIETARELEQCQQNPCDCDPNCS